MIPFFDILILNIYFIIDLILKYYEYNQMVYLSPALDIVTELEIAICR